MSEDDRADTVLGQHPAAFGEGAAHDVLEKRSVLDATVTLLGLVLHRFAILGRERIVRIERVA